MSQGTFQPATDTVPVSATTDLLAPHAPLESSLPPPDFVRVHPNVGVCLCLKPNKCQLLAERRASPLHLPPPDNPPPSPFARTFLTAPSTPKPSEGAGVLLRSKVSLQVLRNSPDLGRSGPYLSCLEIYHYRSTIANIKHYRVTV